MKVLIFHTARSPSVGSQRRRRSPTPLAMASDGPPMLPPSSGSRDSISSVELGAAATIPPPKSPAIPEDMEEMSGAPGRLGQHRKLQRARSSDDGARAMMSSTQSVESGSLFRTVTNIELLPEEQVASMRAVFDMFDESKDGIVQADEVGAILRRLNL